MAGAELTVLAIDDEGLILRLVNAFLRKSRFVAILAENMTIARRICEETERRIDLVLADVFMPGEGEEAFDKCLKRRFPEAKVVYMSGYPTERVQELTGKSLRFFLAKPFTESELIGVLERATFNERSAGGS